LAALSGVGLSGQGLVAGGVCSFRRRG
jgi:hypothetical protein